MKLLLFADQMQDRIIPLNPIVINDEQINFSTKAEHVGVIRSTARNVPNILNRIISSKKATNATLACGLARGHRSNPSACLRVLQLYGVPVLMYGLGSLVLNPSEITTIHQHHKNTVQNLQKLHHGTPQSFIFFMAGCLPVTATLHLRQFSLFGMTLYMYLHKMSLLNQPINLTPGSHRLEIFVSSKICLTHKIFSRHQS